MNRIIRNTDLNQFFDFMFDFSMVNGIDVVPVAQSLQRLTAG